MAAASNSTTSATLRFQLKMSCGEFRAESPERIRRFGREAELLDGVLPVGGVVGVTIALLLWLPEAVNEAPAEVTEPDEDPGGLITGPLSVGWMTDPPPDEDGEPTTAGGVCDTGGEEFGGDDGWGGVGVCV
jgi:hypothetical protein